MSEHEKAGCCSGAKVATEVVNIDPVCGMTVSDDSSHSFEYVAKKNLPLIRNNT